MAYSSSMAMGHRELRSLVLERQERRSLELGHIKAVAAAIPSAATWSFPGRKPRL